MIDPVTWSWLSMERPGRKRLVTSFLVVFLGLVSFSCCMAAEFKKLKTKDMRLDGNLCSLPKSAAFGLGIAALVTLFIAQIVGTSAAGTKLCSRGKSSGKRNQSLAITFLALSWVSFGLAAIMLGAGSSMNAGQSYGRGWLDGKCYVVKDGLFIGAAVLAAATVIFILGFTYTTRARIITPRPTGPELERRSDRGDDIQFDASNWTEVRWT